MTDTTRATIDRFLPLLAKGDADALADVFAEEIDWFVPGAEHLPWTGPRTGRIGTPVAFRFTVRDGLITRPHLFEDTLAVARAMPSA